MQAVGLKILKNKLSEYVRLVQLGETVLVTDRDKVVAELVPFRTERSPIVADAFLADAVRKGWVAPPTVSSDEPPHRLPVASLAEVLEGLDEDRRSVVLPRHVRGSRAFAGEDRSPPTSIWSEPLISSCLLEYEAWTRIHAMNLSGTHAEPLRLLLGRVAMVELAWPMLARALEPFPVPIRTLEALHLASVDFLRRQNQDVELATYVERMLKAAERIGVTIVDLS